MTSEINVASQEERNLFARCHISHACSGDETIKRSGRDDCQGVVF